MNASIPIPYLVGRWVLAVGLGFYFARIERFHRERIPVKGSVLFTSNHPNSITDAFVIGISVPRKINFVATVRLFRFSLIRWLLTRCGVIPVNRKKDDPRAMRTVLDTFEACFSVLEKGEAVGIFPEGITHDDPQLKTVKTGAARMALELEQRHGGRLGLQIVPVGLTFSAKERYRSDALVNFGEPIRVSNFLEGYPGKKHENIQKLTREIEHRIEALILHLPQLERARIIEAVKRLYLDRLYVSNRVIHEPLPPKMEELMLLQAIAKAVDFTYEHHPERASAFTRKLDHYERWLKRLNLSDQELAHFPNKAHWLWRSLGWAMAGVILLPMAFCGWMHRLLPLQAINWALRRFSEHSLDKTHVSTIRILAGIVSFTLFYGIYVAIVQAFFGFPVSLWYALLLPVASLLAHDCMGGVRRFIVSIRTASVLLRAPIAARRIRTMREELIAEIEAARWQVPSETLLQDRKGEL